MRDTSIRPTFDKIWTEFATALAERSTCARTGVGCVIVTEDNHRVLSIGYNGGARGLNNSCDSAEPGNCGCLHAEENALIKMNFNEPSPKKMYTTLAPCLMCAKRAVNAGIQEVIYITAYRKTEGIELLEKAGVKVRQYQAPPNEKPCASCGWEEWRHYRSCPTPKVKAYGGPPG